MMIATRRGMFPRAISTSAVNALGVRVGKESPDREERRSDFHDLGSLLLQQLVDLPDEAIRHLLHVAGLALRVVGRKRAAVLLVLELLVRVVADLADVHAALLGE